MTVDVIYPTNSVVAYYQDIGFVTWSELMAASGSGTQTTMVCRVNGSSSTGDNFKSYRIPIWSFDTSGIPDSASILSAIFAAQITSVSDNFDDGYWDLSLVGGVYTGGNSDYENRGDTRITDDLVRVVETADPYEYTWDFNSYGLSYISKTGTTVIDVIVDQDPDGPAPAHETSLVNYDFTANFGNFPSLIIVHSGGTPRYKEFYYSDTGLSTSTTTALPGMIISKVVFTPKVNTTYLVLYSVLLYSTSTSVSVKVDLYENNLGMFHESTVYVKDTTDYIPAGGAAYFTVPEYTAERTFMIRLYSGSAGTTVGAATPRLLFIPLSPLDQVASTTGRTTYNTDTNWQTATSITFTPPSAGDYLAIGSCVYDGSSTSYDSKVELYDGSTEYGLVNTETTNASTRWSYMYFQKLTLPATSQTISLRYATESTSNTVGVAYRYLILLRLSGVWKNVISAVQDSPQTDTDAVQDHALTASFSSAKPVPHIILACCKQYCASASYSSRVGLYEGTTAISFDWREPKDASNYDPYFCIYVPDSPAATYYIDLKAESSSYDAIADDLRIYGLDLRLWTVKSGVSYGSANSMVY